MTKQTKNQEVYPALVEAIIAGCPSKQVTCNLQNCPQKTVFHIFMVAPHSQVAGFTITLSADCATLSPLSRQVKFPGGVCTCTIDPPASNTTYGTTPPARATPSPPAPTPSPPPTGPRPAAAVRRGPAPPRHRPALAVGPGGRGPRPRGGRGWPGDRHHPSLPPIGDCFRTHPPLARGGA